MYSDQIKILVVDDDPTFVKTFTHLLESKNCLVKSFSDPQLALSCLLNEVFHIAFVDCILKKGKGIKLIMDIRKILGYSVETAIMSGIIPSSTLSHYINEGFCSFFSKPISNTELDRLLKKIKNQFQSFEDTHILTKLFSKESSHLDKMKFLVSVDGLKSHEFFLYVKKVLESKESLKMSLTLNNQKNIIYFNKGFIVDYEVEDSSLFLDKLISKKYLTKQERLLIKEKNLNHCIDWLLTNCILSSIQLMEVKYELLFEDLKKLASSHEVSFNLSLHKLNKPKSFEILNCEKYGKIVFSFFKEKFDNKDLSDFFNEDILKKNIFFQEDLSNNFPEDLPEVSNFVVDIQKGMKLKAIYNKLNNQNRFNLYLWYILLNERVCFSKNQSTFSYDFLKKRYKGLLEFMEKKHSLNDFFSYFYGKNVVDIDSGTVKQIYNNFLMFNHPDKFPSNLPKEILYLMHQALLKMKYYCDCISDPEVKSMEIKKKKQQDMESELLFVKKKKLFQNYMENKIYDKAYSLIKTVSEHAMNKDVEWQLFYIWFSYEGDIRLTKSKVDSYFKNVQSQNNSLMANKYYNYTLALYYEMSQSYEKAISYFSKVKNIEPAFKLAYLGIKRCYRKKALSKKKQSHSLGPIINLFKSLKNKKNKKIS